MLEAVCTKVDESDLALKKIKTSTKTSSEKENNNVVVQVEQRNSSNIKLSKTDRFYLLILVFEYINVLIVDNPVSYKLV